MPALIALALLLTPAARGDGLAEAAVLHEVNVLRADPAAYAAELRRIATGYDGRYFVEAGGMPHASVEGPGAVDEAAAALDHAAPVPALLPDPVLRAAARDLADAQAVTGAIGHVGAAGDTPSDRVRRRGGDIYVSEVIAYGMHAAADVVRQFVVDDGVAGRGHRKMLLSMAFRYAGVWCDPHPSQGTVCVIDLASHAGGRPEVPAG